MKKVEQGLLAMYILVFVAISGSTAFAQGFSPGDIIFLSAGESQKREFYIEELYNIRAPLKNIAGGVVVSIGEAGTLSINLSTQAEMEFGGVMDYLLLGFGFSPDEAVTIISESASTPYSAGTSIPINSDFGLAYTVIMVTKVSPGRNYVEWPVPFTIEFSLSEPETDEEETADE
jgi:hypothetical protein